MSENCSHNCNTCSEECSDREEDTNNFIAKPNSLSNIKRVIGIISGKGGVGKSLVTSLLAVIMKRNGYNAAVLDADITGPSIPKMFGIKDKARCNKSGIFPVKSKTGIDIMSINLLLDNDTDPVIWRGPIIANTVKQFWTDVIWDDIDFMFIDMPPGTGDVPLTVFQSIAVDGIIVVTSPQDLVSMIVEKAVKMAKIMNIPILGLVENMSYIRCPECNKEIKLFGNSNIDEIALKYNINTLSKLPVEPKISAECDKGLIENFEGNYLDDIVKMLKDFASQAQNKS